MATASRRDQGRPEVTVLRGVPYRWYVHLVGRAANRHLRMAYHDGVLEIMAPQLRQHESPSRRINVIVTAVADVLGLPYMETGSATFRRAGAGPRRGTGREPDQSYYFQSVDRFPRDRDPDLDAGDPPPDLWVEVDNRASSQARLPTYARLGVPEVWQYRSRSAQIRFLGLVGTTYQPIERSRVLPPLTPPLVEEALEHGRDQLDSAWKRWVHQWVEQFRPDGPQPVGPGQR